MQFYSYVFLYLLLPKTLSKRVEITCPQHCKCDIFETLRRATCTRGNLAGIESNIPTQTQILDLSFNRISWLQKNVFKEEKLTNLKLLNLSHNIVSHIEMKAFKGLSALRTLDLSYNSVQYLTPAWFRDMTALEELYLRGNGFSKLDSGPLFASKSLKRLDLSLCRISYIGPDSFSQIPNLEVLDVSENYLIHLYIATVEPLTNLQILDAGNNSLSCDGVSKNLAKYCVQKGIRFKDPCKPTIADSEKFQRMVNLAEPEDEKNSWIYDDGQEIRHDNQTTTNATCNNTPADKKSLLQEIVDLSPVLSILLPFIYGIAVGVLIAYILSVFSRKKQSDEPAHDQNLRRSGTFSRMLSRGAVTEERQNLPLREWHLSESTPVLFRKNQC
ncbi:leucine-rich repeat neuronal protein 1 isoform X2 [Tribolium castaneum]|uniref:Reticulon-4 receptor-like Protein n=1 Tax=Tribolium castaneum TaxID=7070 RepID=D6W6Q5_TRICA|nr:PREDICTED: leucine-rich repeat neuronal protein 1 isoform X2 [Tribolium castaneum]EFA10960.2 Reticulon-4 receptor-like Protein [Tribolium castaneum]|eukprot:XP_008200055.1 PREDICTED: leucine-rich repeat neuronal protein 1 isoform X2 [Tribolium castaneum]